MSKHCEVTVKVGGKIDYRNLKKMFAAAEKDKLESNFLTLEEMETVRGQKETSFHGLTRDGAAPELERFCRKLKLRYRSETDTEVRWGELYDGRMVGNYWSPFNPWAGCMLAAPQLKNEKYANLRGKDLAESLEQLVPVVPPLEIVD
jgi:hypothetical protein